MLRQIPCNTYISKINNQMSYFVTYVNQTGGRQGQAQCNAMFGYGIGSPTTKYKETSQHSYRYSHSSWVILFKTFSLIMQNYHMSLISLSTWLILWVGVVVARCIIVTALVPLLQVLDSTSPEFFLCHIFIDMIKLFSRLDHHKLK